MDPNVTSTFSTRLLAKDQPISSKDPPRQCELSAILLGSPGETNMSLDSTTKVTKDGTRSGLQGVLRDLMLARAFLSKNSYGIFECMHGIRLFKSEVVGALAMFFNQEHQPKHYVVYFSGHGDKHTGNWIFTDGELSFNEIYDIFIKYSPTESCMSIVADCCHSGAWVEQVLASPASVYDVSRVAVQAACRTSEVCWDTSVGGLFTKSWVSGAYYRLAERQIWAYNGQKGLDEYQVSLKNSLSTYTPWQGFISQNPAIHAARLFVFSMFYTCSNECANHLSADQDLEHCQHPIATHPFAFNLIFHDNRFSEFDHPQRFPDEKVAPRQFIDLTKFWLGCN